MKRKLAKILLVSAWMYFGGPLLWGAWMIWRLGILAPGDSLALLWPVGLLVLLAFFVVNLLNLRRARPSPMLHCALITAFGSIGTMGFLLLPKILGMPGPWWTAAGWSMTALAGSLAGASLVGMFYPLFSASLFSGLPGSAMAMPTLQGFHGWAYLAGVFAYAGTALLSGQFLTFNPTADLGMLFPLLMSGLMLWRARSLFSRTGGKTRHAEA